MTLDDLIEQAQAMRKLYPGDTPVVTFWEGSAFPVSLPLQRGWTTDDGPPRTVVGLREDREFGWDVDEHPDAGKPV